MNLSNGQIARVLSTFGFAITDAHARQVSDYIALLLRWNRRVNLTSITDPEEILARHFGESLFGIKVANIESGDLLDIGSGAGFPAIPIGLFCPHIHATLLEPNVKKAVFLSEACRVLSIAHRVKICRFRLEDYHPHDARFDFLTSRAVRVTSLFLDRSQELLRPGGKLALWLGREDAASVARHSAWTWSEVAIIPGSERRVILCGIPGAGYVSRETPGDAVQPGST